MQKREKIVGEIAEKLVSFRFGKKILRYDIEYSVQVFYGINCHGHNNYCLERTKQEAQNTVEPSQHTEFYYTLHPLTNEIGKYHYNNEYYGKHYYMECLLGHLQGKPLFYLTGEGFCKPCGTPDTKYKGKNAYNLPYKSLEYSPNCARGNCHQNNYVQYTYVHVALIFPKNRTFYRFGDIFCIIFAN